MNISRIKKELHISFTNHDLLRQAFTHSSYVNEHRKKQFTDNERLEFLGDAVLELGISQYLYRHHPHMPEGEMTKLRAAIVCEESLVGFAEDLDFGDYILLGKGEEQTGGRSRPALLADVFESFLGAFYLDQGYDQVLLFLEDHILPKISSGAFSHAMDYKSQLQEFVQQTQNVTLITRLVKNKSRHMIKNALPKSVTKKTYLRLVLGAQRKKRNNEL